MRQGYGRGWFRGSSLVEGHRRTGPAAGNIQPDGNDKYIYREIQTGENAATSILKPLQTLAHPSKGL